MERSRFYLDFSTDLRSERNKNQLLFYVLAKKSAVRHLIYFVNSRSNYYANKIFWNLRYVDTL